MKSVDVLVAVRNEEKTIPVFINEFNTLIPDDIKLNIIFLEDGSSDGTVKLLQDLSRKMNNVNFISLDNKFGQYAALTYGLSLSKADAVITMDVDGGHPVETAVEMIKSFQQGYNLVQGHRIVYKRKKFYRTIMSYAYNLFFYIIVGVNFFKQNVMFRLMDKSTKEKFLSNKNWWHIFKSNFKSKDGINTGYIEYEAPERELGESKYNFFRLFKLSYKSFFSLLSVFRLIIINIVLAVLMILTAKYVSVILSILVLIILLITNLSYFFIVKHYPIPELKIISTSLPEIRK
jgi:glycosyltransferase involved in cell wall biosynthesis